jgi:tubulin--tyrosine ligase
MDRPLLYNKRKFDIRCYLLFTTINGYQRAFWYQEGYIRTSSFEFSVKNLSNKMVHLTNDAVQKRGEGYGKFEKGNKVSYEEFSKFLE